MSILIVSRHKGAIEWLKEKGITGEVVSHVSNPDEVRGRIEWLKEDEVRGRIEWLKEDEVRGRVVIGNIPLYLAARALIVGSIEMEDLPPEKRGQDLTPEDMNLYHANVVWYSVKKVGVYCHTDRYDR